MTDIKLSEELLRRAHAILRRAESWLQIQLVAMSGPKNKATAIRDSMQRWILDYEKTAAQPKADAAEVARELQELIDRQHVFTNEMWSARIRKAIAALSQPRVTEEEREALLWAADLAKTIMDYPPCQKYEAILRRLSSAQSEKQGEQG